MVSVWTGTLCEASLSLTICCLAAVTAGHPLSPQPANWLAAQSSNSMPRTWWRTHRGANRQSSPFSPAPEFQQLTILKQANVKSYFFLSYLTHTGWKCFLTIVQPKINKEPTQYKLSFCYIIKYQCKQELIQIPSRTFEFNFITANLSWPPGLPSKIIMFFSTEPFIFIPAFSSTVSFVRKTNNVMGYVKEGKTSFLLSGILCFSNRDIGAVASGDEAVALIKAVLA